MVVILVWNARFEWYIEGVVFAIVLADLVECACSWEEVLAVLMEGDTHAAVWEVEGLLDSVSVVHVDVEVEYSWVDLQQLENW